MRANVGHHVMHTLAYTKNQNAIFIQVTDLIAAAIADLESQAVPNYKRAAKKRR